MSDVESFLESPGDTDIRVSDVFVDDMFTKLEKRMLGCGWPSIRSHWDGDFRNRKIISEFMKDSLLGSKRLAPMPDRITNTINIAGSTEPVCRPTVINMYDGDLDNLDQWYSAWEAFMFVLLLRLKQRRAWRRKFHLKCCSPSRRQSTLILLRRRKWFPCHCRLCVEQSLMRF